MKLLGSFLLAFAFLALPTFAGQTDADIAALFYPAALGQFVRDTPGTVEAQQWSIAAADLDGTGRADYLVVAYSNGHIGRIRVIKKTPTGPVLVADPDTPSLYDNAPALRLIDLNHDGKPAIVATYHIGNHGQHASWIFRWDGAGLKNVNPVDMDGSNEVVAFTSPNFVDLDGSGQLVALDPTESFGVHVEFATPEESHPVVPDCSYTVYRLTSAGRFNLSADTVAFYGEFVRGAGKPKVREESFAATPGNYLLRIVNGDSGATAVDSAEIQINRATVLGPSAFKQKQHIVIVPVTLGAENLLHVELRSKPGSKVALVLSKANQ